MKKLYWRPATVSVRVLALLSLVAFAGLLSVEQLRVPERRPMFREKLSAAQTAGRAFHIIKEERERMGIPIDPEVDPLLSGMVGELLSPTTTNTGHLSAKQTAVNPNFAAVVVEMLHRAGVHHGDTVAVGMSGSFPALNVAVLSACMAMQLRCLVISSAGSSQWGANHPQLSWPAMESIVAERGVLPIRSLAVSPGGVDDRAVGLSARGKDMLDEAIAAAGLTKLSPKSYDDSLDQRMSLYREHAGSEEIRAYINVGGGTTSVGTRVGKHMFSPGLNLSPPRGPTVDSVMSRFAVRGTPVIHLTRVEELAERYGLPVAPTEMAAPGQGQVFSRTVRSKVLAGLSLLALFGVMIGLLRFDLGHRLIGRRALGSGRPEPMV